ncbi:MAG TPA: histone deacetylase family protein [Steroidobacteraceae bacterium]|nr:histone deacetylase family protein [Steroidobacteraceae bacterium]
MQTFFHADQSLHHPRAYLSRGKMRSPQEIPERAVRLVAACRSMGFEILEPGDFGMAPIAAVHDANYLAFLEAAHREWKRIPDDWGDEVMSNVYVYEGNPLRGVLAQAARYLADGSCPVGTHTWRSAYGSAQSAVAAADAINGGCREAYALCRPPGHHARADRAGGFCYLNNAAIAAEVLRRAHGRVAILDTDMHHGQGIQEIFYSRADVLYVSIHGDPTNFYPVVAGFEEERGEGAGTGFNVNLPMPHGSTEAAFFDRVGEAFQELERFKPDALVLALGFDIYKDDPQSQVSVTTNGFERLGAAIGAQNIPTVVVQEGGYHIESLEDNARAFFSGFLSCRSSG